MSAPSLFRFFCRRFVAIASLVGTFCWPNLANAQPPEPKSSGDVTVEQIFDAWAARHEQVHSGRFKMTEERVLLPGSQMGRRNRALDDEGSPFPAEPQILVEQHEVLFDGVLVRRDRRGDEWHLRAEGLVPLHLVNVSDGERELTYYGFEERTADDVHPQAEIHPVSGDRAGGFIGTGHGLLPIFITLRAMHPAFSRPTGPGPYNASRYQLLDREGMIDGQRCLILDEIRTGESSFHRIWVDPQRDFVVLRNESGVREQILFQLDIEYELDASGIWVPQSWTHLRHAEHESGGRVLKESTTFTVTEYALNPPIDPHEFDFELPSGAVGSDDSSGRRDVFLIRDDGIRPVTREEMLRGARLADLMATPSGQALLPPKPAWWQWRWLALAVALIGFGWLLCRRR